jgi:hypothetical protein
MTRIGKASFAALFMVMGFAQCAVGQNNPNYVKGYTPPSPLKYQVDVKTMRGAGINVRLLREKGSDPTDGFYASGPPFPHKCFHEDFRELTLSDRFFDHYKSRGFSLPTLCLAVSAGGWVHYNLETGAPLRVLYTSQYGGGYLLDVPDCFKDGAPFLDCKQNFEHGFGLKLTNATRNADVKTNIGIDRAVRALISSGKFSRECTCDDLEVYNSPGETRPSVQIKGSGYGGTKPVEQYSCRVETMPTCASKWLKGREIEGWMLYEVADGYLLNRVSIEGLANNMGTAFGPFDISPKLPHGYAYQIGHPEGDDDTPFVELTPGTKLNVGD